MDTRSAFFEVRTGVFKFRFQRVKCWKHNYYYYKQRLLQYVVCYL